MTRPAVRTLVAAAAIACLAERPAHAHPGHDHTDGAPAAAVPDHMRTRVAELNAAGFASRRPVRVSSDDDTALDDDPAVDHAPASTCDDRAAPAPPSLAIHGHFQPFASSLTLRWDDSFYYVGSNGLPDHPMMIGIRAWQQQVPLPQKYFDQNAWRIPLHPVPALKPATTKNQFLRGAIALAVNGVPIFNPLNNRGADSYLIGELDEWGGHCGRGDDYHYHLPPVHLEKQVGKGRPIAYALDGYPIYGYDEADGSKVTGLDSINGHHGDDGAYHYHATKTHPYLNGGFHGEVVERDGQVDPQPRAQPVRESLPPLAGARITDFKSTGPNKYELKYEINGRPGYVRYAIADDGSVAFTFIDTAGDSTRETYQPSRRRTGESKPNEDKPKENKPANRPATSRGPAPGAARKPWIAEHLAELDVDKNGALTREEMRAEALRTFAAYDIDSDGRLTKSEYDRPGVRTPLAGFVRGHAAEIDADGDTVITKQEVTEFALQLFGKADRNADGKTTLEEASISGPQNRKP